jgi:cell division septum initiation protein DivIVA
MPYTPVELRHVRIGRSLWGYRPDKVDRLIEEVADSFEAVWGERGELDDRVHELETQLAELKRREELLAQMRSLGRRVYAEKPKQYARRLKRYLTSAQAAEPTPR